MLLLAYIAISLAPIFNEGEIDIFMRAVLENQKAAQAELTQFIFTEEESLEVHDGSGSVRESRRASYVWFAREGKLVRSPKSVDGAEVGEKDRLAYEESWLNDGRKGKRRSDIAEDSFFNFRYEPGAYFLAGREKRDGRSIVLIEYYPEEHFAKTGRDPIGGRGDKHDAAFDKTSLVLFHIDEEERQIVQVDFRNITMDYLPSSWLVDFEKFEASLQNRRTSDGIWVPDRLELDVVLRQAAGTFEISLRRTFAEYSRAGVRIDFQIPREGQSPEN